MSQVNIERPPVHPIERLNWEHARLLEKVEQLQRFAEKKERDVEQIGSMAVKLMEALEHHQEAEERFLFPLISGLGEGLFTELREEHLQLVRASDQLSLLAGSGLNGSTAGLLVSFKKDLQAHFTREETAVFLKAESLLSPAQVDILRIKFASRNVLKI